MTPTNMMSTDVRENDKGYDVDIDMPGFKKDDISVSLNNGYLTVSAHKDEAAATRMSPASGFVVNVTSAPARAASTSHQVKENDIHANYQNGTLCIQVPKIERSRRSKASTRSPLRADA